MADHRGITGIRRDNLSTDPRSVPGAERDRRGLWRHWRDTVPRSTAEDREFINYLENYEAVREDLFSGVKDGGEFCPHVSPLLGKFTPL